MAVRRHRARNHLRQIMGGLGAVVGGWLAGLRHRRAAALALTPLVVVAALELAHLLLENPDEVTTASSPTGARGVSLVSGPDAPVVDSTSSTGAALSRSPAATTGRGAAVFEVQTPGEIPGWRNGSVRIDERHEADAMLCVSNVAALPDVCTPPSPLPR